MAKDIREYLNRCVERLEAKRHSLDEAIRALHTLREQSGVIGDDLAEVMTNAVVRKVDKPGLFEPEDGYPVNEPGDVNSERARGSSQFQGKNFARVLQFFLSTKNEYASNQEIRRACGITRGSVAVVLYTTHADLFERKPLSVEDKKKIVWRLNEKGIERARSLYPAVEM